ncbi:MAG: LamG domain-containing protein [Phycisphaerales bacterium]
MHHRSRWIILPSALVLASICAADAGAGLLAHFTANGTPNDRAGGHMGTLVNGAGFGPGIEDQAFELDGSNQYVVSDEDPDWAFGMGPFTVSCWVNFDVIKSGQPGQLPNVFVGQDDGGGQLMKWVFFTSGQNDVSFHINGTAFIFMSAPIPFTPSPGDWHHYVVTRLGQAFTFYVDGNSLGSAQHDVFVPNATYPLTIGQAEGLGYLDGRIDDVQIYNEALTQAQVLFLTENPGSAITFECPADLNDDGLVDGADLGLLLGSWGPCGACTANIDGQGGVDGADLGLLLGSWGPCASP